MHQFGIWNKSYGQENLNQKLLGQKKKKKKKKLHWRNPTDPKNRPDPKLLFFALKKKNVIKSLNWK